MCKINKYTSVSELHYYYIYLCMTFNTISCYYSKLLKILCLIEADYEFTTTTESDVYRHLQIPMSVPCRFRINIHSNKINVDKRNKVHQLFIAMAASVVENGCTLEEIMKADLRHGRRNREFKE